MISILFVLVTVTVSAISSTDLCHFDGKIYKKGDVIPIAKCLGEMTCLGNESYGDLKQFGGICETERDASDDGQSGCLFDGRVYNTGDIITIPKCLAQMTCLGKNSYSAITQLNGICP